MKRILFVDDEQPALESLRIRLHRMQCKWEMCFVDSGAHALEQLERQHFDVLVTDMRMPGMDGPALLLACRERWPDVVRLVLSGYTDAALMNRALPVIHQYLEKPCEPSHLENVIDRCLGLHELLQGPALRSLVGGVRQLPALPRTFARLQSLLHSEQTSVRDVGAIIAADSAVTARVLQMVNSAFFRHARRITNIEQAVTYLGFATTRNLVMAAEVFGRAEPVSAFAKHHLDRLQDHAQRVAGAARALAAGTEFADDAMLAALLHDIGYWVLLQECPDRLQQAVHAARVSNVSLVEAEIQAFGASHGELGAYLLGLWGLPFPIIEAVAHHHAPRRVAQTRFDVLAAVAIAHSLSGSPDTSVWDPPGIPHDAVDATYLASIDAPFDWDEAQRRVRQNLRSTGTET
jgi:HD-like signal output (HDOD) protein